MSHAKSISTLGLALALVSTAHADTSPKPAATTLAPKPSTTPADDPWAGRSDLFVPPTVVSKIKVELGAVERYTLPNGLMVIAVPRHHAPVFDMSLAIRVDDAGEPLEKMGVAQFTAQMLRKGTKKRTSDQIADSIDFVGSEIEAGADDTGTIVMCRGRARALALCLDLSSDLVMNPAFPEGELGEIRDQLIAGVEQSRDNPGQLAQVHAANLYFGDDDGRGRPDSKRSIQAIDRATLVAFHSAWYHPNNSVLTISGDFEPKALRAALTKWFGGWKRGEAPKLLARGLPARGPMKIRLVDKPDATQAQIVVVGPGIKHADADLCATRLMNYTLGAGAFSSRLMKVVRSENAKTYGARSKFDTHREPGAFTATTFTREAEAASTIKLVLGEIERMQASGPSAAELVAAKSNMIGGYGLRFETGSDLARSLVIGELDGLPPDHVLKYPACLDAVTLPAVVQAARDHLAPQALVVLGNAKVLAPMLTAAKLAPTETIGYMEPISLAERKAAAEAKAKEQKAAASATPAEVTEGKRLLELALKAKGAESIAKIADLHLNAVGSLTAEGQNMRIGFEGFYAPSRGQREDISMQGQVMSQVLDGAKAFAKVAMTAKDLPADQAAGMKRELWRNGNLVVLNAVAPTAKLRALPQVTVGKQKLDALQVVSPDGDTMRLLFDPQSHQLLRVIWTEDGKEEHQELSDYKAEGGISIARHIVMEGEGHRVELTIDKVQINKGLPKETFAR